MIIIKELSPQRKIVFKSHSSMRQNLISYQRDDIEIFWEGVF